MDYRNKFPVIHKLFYEKFGQWRDQIKEKTQIIDGVYVLYANRPVHRLIGADNQGVLYIGKGRNIIEYKRIGNLINSLNETDTSHQAGVRLNPLLKEVYPIADMEIEVILAEDYSDLESRLLHAYSEQFGELPPLNRVLP